MPIRSPEKRDAFAELLTDGVTALHMDSRVAGLRVPAHLRTRAWLVLNFSYGYQLADFHFDEDGVAASLSFGGRPFPCFVPWEAVFGMSDDSRDKFHLWEEDMPPEAIASMAAAAEASAPETAPVPREPSLNLAVATKAEALPATAPPRRTFAVIDGGGEGSSGPGGHLERIK